MAKKNEKASDFDYIKALEDMELISFLKEGIIKYITAKNLEIKSEKDLKDLLKQFGGK